MTARHRCATTGALALVLAIGASLASAGELGGRADAAPSAADGRTQNNGVFAPSIRPVGFGPTDERDRNDPAFRYDSALGSDPAFSHDGDGDLRQRVQHLAASPNQGPVIPNDTLYFNGQPNMKVIRAPDAWGVTYGTRDVTIAHISTGIDLDHPDLVNKLWRNAGEVEGNGLDDDMNGYVDDLVGWDFVNQDRYPEDFARGELGTMSAGIMAAESNNRLLVAGLSWGARIMPLKILALDENEQPTGSLAALNEAIRYAADNGAKVIFVEGWVFEEFSGLEAVIELGESIAYAHSRAGAVVVAPAGDCGGEPTPSFCPSSEAPIYPAAMNHVIGVQSVHAKSLAQLPTASAGFWVALSAPGYGDERGDGAFYTTSIHDASDHADLGVRSVGLHVTPGVSTFAAAHVAGAAALLLGVNSTLSPFQVEQALCTGANRNVGGPYAFVDGRYWNDRYGCGVLDVEAAVDAVPWEMRVRPGNVTVFTSGLPPDPAVIYTSENLNEGSWEMRSTDGWLRIQPEPQTTGYPSRMRAVVDLEILGLTFGGIQAGGVYTGSLSACPIPSARGRCAEYTLTVRVLDTLTRILMPWMGNR